MKNQMRAETVAITVGPEPTPASVATRDDGARTESWAWHHAQHRWRKVAGVIVDAAWFVLLFVAAALMAPITLHSQTVPALSFAGTQTTVGSGLLYPYGVAADAKGNVFIADSTNNRVLEIPGNGGAQITIGSGLNTPLGVAVDGAGNVFIADDNNNRVVEVPADGSGQTTVGSGLNSPHGVAVDGAGDVFIADTVNNRVVEVPAGGGAQITIGSGLSFPFGVAVDGAGDVFIADLLNNRVVEVPAGGGAQITIGSGLNGPGGVAVDGAGNVFIADSFDNRVVEVPAGGSAQITISSGLNSPEGVAVDGTGDVFIADTFNNRILEVERFAGKFASANVCPAGKTSPAPCSQTLAMTYSVTTGGTVGGVNVLTQGAPNLDFTLASNTCKGQLTTGTSCTVNVKFTPKAPGLRMGAVQLLYGSGATQTVLASTPVYGNAQGPAIAFSPSTQTKLGSGLNGPYGVAVDAKGDIFVADSYNNQVVEIPAGGGAQTTIASGLSFPQSVAVDGAGDVFIADSNNSRVVEVPAGGGAPITVGTGLSYPTGVAVDGAGNIFIADLANSRVVEVTAGGTSEITIGNGFSFPEGVAVDGAGDVFVANTFLNNVVEVPAGGGAQITIGSGLTRPSGVAVDAAGDVFISDLGNSRVVEVPAGGGAQVNIATGLVLAYGLTLDAKGNLFIASESGNTVLELHRSAGPTLNFTSGVGNTSYSKSVTVQNVGNQFLNAVAPGLNIGTDFEQVPGTGTPADCIITFSLAPGTTCNISLVFTPPTINSFKSTVVVTDNALNATAAMQTINLNGTGEALLTPVVHVHGGPFVYNGLAESSSCTATGTGGVSVVGTCSFTYNGSTTAPASAGTYTVTASFNSANPFYGSATGTGKLLIEKAPLTVTANGAIFLQGGTFPTFTVSYAGFVNVETQTVLTGKLKITTTATPTSPLGNYPIVPSGLTAPNYKITFVDGTLAVLDSVGLSGTYTIQNLNSGLVLGVAGASTSQGANIVQWTANGGPDQNWTLTLGVKGAYLLHNVNSGYVMGVNGASTSPGANLIQWQSNGSADQEWLFTPIGSNWTVTNANSGLEMDIDGASMTPGAQAFQWTIDGSPSQVWTLVPVQ